MDASQNTEALKFTDFFTGWKLLHRLSRKYGPAKASFINSIFMWLSGIAIIYIFNYLWPDIFSNIWRMIFIVTLIMLGFYRQNKKLLEMSDSGNSGR